MNLSQEQQQKLAAIGSEFDLSLILLFGSKAKGNQHKDSDLDIAVFKKNDSQQENGDRYLELLTAMQQLFPDEELDLSLMNHADPLFLNQVMQNAILLVGDEKHYKAERLRAFKQFQDFRPYLKMERDFLDRFIKKRRKTG